MDIGFLFDLDGVLIDTKEQHYAAWQALAKEDSSFALSEDEFLQTFGMSNDLILARLFPDADQTTHKRWAERKEALFRSLALDSIVLLPGVASFLKEVKEAKIPHIIASSTPVSNLQAFIRSTDLGHYFSSFVSAEEVKRGKPYPDVFEEAAARIHMDPKNCVVFEDSPAGLRAGKDTGAFLLALATTHPKEDLPFYDLCIENFEGFSLEPLLKGFRKLKAQGAAGHLK